MFEEIPEQFLMLIGGAFVLGWLVAKFGTFLSNRIRDRRRDPRDDRIRSLEAEHRIAKTDVDKAQDEISKLQAEAKEAQESIEKRDKVIDDQMEAGRQLRSDLKDSVLKTRELREELSNRATENVRSEVKLREVETELEVSRASTDLIATGVLDYSVAPDDDEDEADQPSAYKAAT